MRSQRIDLVVLLQIVLLACTPVLFVITLGNDVLVVTRIGLCVVMVFSDYFLLPVHKKI